MNLMRLGRLLRELRAQRPAASVAGAVRIAVSTLYRYEGIDPATNLEPSALRLQRLLNHYGASPAQRLLAWQLLEEEKSRRDADAVVGHA